VIKHRLLAVLACAALGICCSTASMAKGLTYTYGEAGYDYLDSDTVDGDGLGGRLSYGATDHVHLRVDYTHFYSASKTNSGFFGSKSENVNIDRFVLGMGGNYTLLEKKSWIEALDILGTISYYDAEFSGNSNNSDRGYVLEPGVRALFTKKLELNARVIHMHIDNFDEVGFGAGAVYKFYKKYSVVGKVSHFSQDDTNEAFVGIRVDF
jgi:hypothetical protein